MALRIALVVVIAAAAGAIALVERRRHDTRRPVVPPDPVPGQVDRADFARPDLPWLVVLFSSDRCETCAAMAERIAPLASPSTVIEEVEWSARPALHEKYRIEGVPVVAVYDADGVLRAGFVGTTPAEPIWSAVTALRGT